MNLLKWMNSPFQAEQDEPSVQVASDVLEAYWSDHNIVYAAVDLS